MRAHSRRSRISVERPAEGDETGSPHRLRPSAGDHAHENAISAHEMMVERRADVRGHQTANGNADKGVDVEKLLRERAALGPDRRQVEPAEDDYGCPISRGGNPTCERLHEEKRVEPPMRRVCGEPLHRGHVSGQREGPRWPTTMDPL